MMVLTIAFAITWCLVVAHRSCAVLSIAWIVCVCSEYMYSEYLESSGFSYSPVVAIKFGTG
jgi:multisubunit Na+/H+ antiporter MnhE subunit